MVTVASVCALTPASAQVPTIPQVPAFLPTVDQVAPTQAMPLDGTWLINTIGKKIRIEAGRAYAVDSWVHLFVLKIDPLMVVIEKITPTGPGEYAGQDLPLMGPWKAKVGADRSLTVSVAGALGPASYRLIPVQLDNPQWYQQEMAAAGLAAPQQGYQPQQPAYEPKPPSYQTQQPTVEPQQPVYRPAPPPNAPAPAYQTPQSSYQPQQPAVGAPQPSDRPRVANGQQPAHQAVYPTPGTQFPPTVAVKPVKPTAGKKLSLKQSADLIGRNTAGLQRALKKLSDCLNQGKNRDKMIDAIRHKNIAAATKLKNRCMSPSQMQALRIPSDIVSRFGIRPRNSKEKDYDTLAIGMAGGVMILVGGGGGAGMIWDQSGQRQPRLFTTAEFDFGLGVTVGADLVVSVGANNMPTSAGAQNGLSVTFGGKYVAGGSVSIDFTRGDALAIFPSGKLESLTVAGGAGIGAEVGTMHNTTTWYSR
jgi:hypothetical protein